MSTLLNEPSFALNRNERSEGGSLTLNETPTNGADIQYDFNFL